MDKQLVVFNLANEHYGVDIATVQGIIKLQAITVVPRAPRFVEGVTNLRGKILPVIDLRKRFGLTVSEADKDTRIVVVEMNGTTVGLIVDRVSEVLRVNDDSIEPPAALITSLDTSFIKGIAKLEERLIILLDLNQVLSLQEADNLRASAPVLAG